jgi:drug/metabolite transporter (DMT)-like permease
VSENSRDNTGEEVADYGPSLIGVAFVLVAAVGFSAKAVLVKLAYLQGVDAVTLLALRMLLSVPFFLIVAAWLRRTDPLAMSGRDWASVVGLGLLGYYLASLLDFLGLEHVSAGLERLVLFLYPTLVVIITALVFRRPVGRREAAALALSYGGIALVFLRDVSSHGADVPFGALLVFGSALAYAVYLVGSGEVLRRLGAMRFTAYAMTVACGASVAQFLATEPLAALRQPPPVYALALAMALLSTVMPAFLLSAGIRRVGARSASLIGAMGPASTIFLAALFLGEPITGAQLAGTALVITGVLAVSLPGRMK